MTQLIMGHGVSGHYGTSLAPCAIPSIASSFSRRVGMHDGHRTHPRETNSPDAHRPLRDCFSRSLWSCTPRRTALSNFSFDTGLMR